MADNDPQVTPWSVTPHPFVLTVSGWREHTKGCSTAAGLGCSAIFIAGALAWFLLKTYPQAGEKPAAFWLWFVITVVVVILVLSLLAYISRAHTHARKAAAAAEAEARVRYADIKVQVAGIDQARQQADFYLTVAEREFKQHRYAPFWDAMEAAATAIGNCHTSQGYLAFDIEQYVNVLSGRIHDFPAWDHAVESIPEVAPALSRFSDLKNSAESDYQFASMREFRETRQVMIAGFKTLGEALRHLETAVVKSIGDLKRAVDRSVLLRAADSAHLQTIARFLLPSGRTPGN